MLSPHPSAVKCITRVAEVMDEAARRGRRAGRRHQLDDDGHARGHAGADEASRRGGDPGDRRHGSGSRGVQRRASRRTASAPATRRRYIERTANVKKAVRDIVTGKTFDNGVLCSSENSVVVDEADRRRREAGVRGAGRLLHERGRDGRGRESAGHAAAAAQPGAGRQVGAVHRARSAASRCRPIRGSSIAPLDGRRPRLSRCRSRSSARSCPFTSSRTGARAASAASRSCGTAAWVTPCRSTRRTSGHPRVRPQEARLPHHRQLADDTRVDRADDRSRSGDDARMRRIRRQHHVGQISPRHLLNIKRLAYESVARQPRFVAAGGRGCRAIVGSHRRSAGPEG